ncbi:MAG: 3-oxoacyl-[acyl-carrier-protein] synthase [Clostridiales bacterium]|nr:3-oxoacyl-[acyl-carrier-protein] synthase [Clostridiales bacterium]
MFGQIIGTGMYRPEQVLTNEELSKIVDTTDEWITERTGIRRRHIAKEDTTVSMAVKASVQALENANIGAEEIDLILFASFSANVLLPSAACAVQREIGASKAVGFDINAACSGFVFAYNTAQMYLAGGQYQTILVIGAESLSHLLDWSDRGTCILFGDGAGAVVLRANEQAMFSSVMHSNGAKADALTLESRHQADWEMRLPATYIHMDGKAVFQFAIKEVPRAIEELMSTLPLGIEEIDWFLLHQANKRIIGSVAKRLSLSEERFPVNLMEYGNTSSASIPILLHELAQEGQLKRGQKIIMAGFGAGLSWGATYLEW